jgi:hypothetical protein
MSFERDTVELVAELHRLLARSRRLRLLADDMEIEIQELRRRVAKQCAIQGPEAPPGASRRRSETGKVSVRIAPRETPSKWHSNEAESNP